MTSASALPHRSFSTGLGRKVAAGAAGGVAGGLVFGMLMALMGMLPMVAAMVGSDSAAVGFGVHMMISVLIGWGLTVPFGGMLLTTYAKGALVGLAYGALWWVLGPLVIMPAVLGMPLFAIDATAMFSLMGHLMYGVILGLVAVRVLKDQA